MARESIICIRRCLSLTASNQPDNLLSLVSSLFFVFSLNYKFSLPTQQIKHSLRPYPTELVGFRVDGHDLTQVLLFKGTPRQFLNGALQLGERDHFLPERETKDITEDGAKRSGHK